MNQNPSASCLLGENIISRLLSVFYDGHEENLLNDSEAENRFIAEINQKIKQTCDIQLASAIQNFFTFDEAESQALAFDVHPEHLSSLKEGLELKTDQLLSSTRKVVVLIALNAQLKLEVLDSMIHDVISVPGKNTDQEEPLAA